MAAKMKPNRRVQDRKRRRRLALWAAALGTVALTVGFAAQRLPARTAMPEEPSVERTLEEEVEAAAPPGPRALPVTVVARSAMEGFDLPEGELVEGLPADTFFVLESERAIPDLRFRLFDEAHRLVAGEETIEVGHGTRYLLLPGEALVAGAKYTLIAEGQEGSQAIDVSGQRYLPSRYAIVIQGG